MRKDLKFLLPATCCALVGFSIKNASPELGFSIFITSFYFLEGWKSYILHPKKNSYNHDEKHVEKDNEKLHVKRKL